MGALDANLWIGTDSGPGSSNLIYLILDPQEDALRDQLPKLEPSGSNYPSRRYVPTIMNTAPSAEALNTSRLLASDL